MINFLKQNQSSGQIMVECLVAISIAVVGLLGIFSLLTNSMGINRDIANQYIAAELAAEGIELVKNMVDGNIIAGRAFNDGPCLSPRTQAMVYSDINDVGSVCSGGDISDDNLLFDTATGLYSYAGDVTTEYKRAITIEWPAPEQIKVKSVVSWVGHTGTSKIELEDSFFNWR